MTDTDQLRESYLNGRILLVDKPYRWTSFDAVNKIKSILRYRLKIKKIRIGHAGTLDPLATGLLIICTGRSTKLMERFRELDKSYTGTFVLGQTSPSYDLETTPSEKRPVDHLPADRLTACAEKLSGPQMQMPPQYSAKKVGGERAYNQARQGMTSELKPTPVHITKFQLTSISLPTVDFHVQCSKGTYIRALARDYGECLGTGAFLSSLRRTEIRPFHVDNALAMEEIQEYLLTQLDGKADIHPGDETASGTMS